MKFMVILLVANALTGNVKEYTHKEPVDSKEECMAIGQAEAHRRLAMEPYLVIGLVCQPLDEGPKEPEPLPGTNT